MTLREHLSAMGASTVAADAYLALRREGVAPPPGARRELEALRLVLPGIDELVPLRLATSAWATERRTQLDLLEHSARLAVDTATEQGGSTGFLDVLSGLEQCAGAMDHLQRSAQHTVRAFDRPPYLSPGQVTIAPAQPETIARGVRYQAVYLASNLHSEETRDLITASVEMGEDARVHPDLPMRITIADGDRCLVILPQPKSDDADPADTDKVVDALLVYPSAFLDALIRLFESTWARAIPVGGLLGGPRGPLQGEDRQILALMSSGLTDARIAAALGVSERTMARRISRIQEQMGASNRFMIGLMVGRDGLI